jgi:hypothetical protein
MSAADVKTLSQLRYERILVDSDAPGVGRVLVSDDDVPPGQQVWVRSLEGTGVDPVSYAGLQEAAHLWIHADYDHDLGRLVGVEYAIDIGMDYVMLPFRFGNSTFQLARRVDLWDHIPQFAALRDAFRKNREARRRPQDVFFADLLAPHIVEGSLQAVFWAADQRFSIMDLCASGADLQRWQSMGGEA